MWNINPLIKSFNNSSKNFSLENNKLIKPKIQEQYYSINPSSIQFGFNFYFNNIKSSPFIQMNSPDEQKNFNTINNNFNQRIIPISLLFKSSLEKSGYQIPYKQTIINKEYFNEHNNINNYYDDTRFFNNPININYPKYNNNVLNNIYPTIAKFANVKILSNNNNIKIQKDKIINEKNIENKKENINYDILNNIIKNDKKVVFEIKANNLVMDNKEFKDKDNSFNNKTKVYFEHAENNKNGISKNFLKKKRFRKNSEQIFILSKFYNEHKNWTKKEIKEISKNTGLKEKKIYKWLWDKKNKYFNNTTKFIINKANN